MKIVVDSGCDITADMRNKNGINIERVPLSLQLEDKQYVDDYNLDIDNYLNEMKNINGVPKTAAPPPALYMDKFSGEESVFAITISSHLSASYSNAVLAKNTYDNEPGKKRKFIHVFDSLSASVGQTMIALKTNEFIQKNVKESDIVENVNSFIKDMRTYFILERYENLVKNGRIGPYVAKFASMLSIKPICAGINGKLELVNKARGTQKAFSKLVDMIAAEPIDFRNRTIGISHVKCPDRAMEFKEMIMKRIPFKDAIIVEASGLCATYADSNGLIVAF